MADDIQNQNDDAQVDAMLAMSDDEIANMVDQPSATSAPKEEPVKEVVAEEQPKPEEENSEDEKEVKGEEPDEVDDSADDDVAGNANASKDKGKASPKDEAKPEPNAEAKPEGEASAEEALNYEESYKKIMAPFKANGREVQLKSPEEAVKLMQMGANYTKKMQALQPHLKMVKMLENNDLLNEEKLSFLIDLSKKNPQAIQKLVKDSGIDPLDIDSHSNQDYRPNNYTVSDQEIKFNHTVDELRSSNEGIEILRDVSTQWDVASKSEVFNEPEILNHLASQKQAGIYDQITAEMDRQRVLGNLNGVGFLTAYAQVGQYLQANNLLKVPQQTQADPSPQFIDTRKASPKSTVANSDKVKSAAPTQASPAKKAQQDFNPLAMSDDDFLNSDLAKRL